MTAIFEIQNGRLLTSGWSGSSPKIKALVMKRMWKNVVFLSSVSPIYTTKIDGGVCPPNISETVAGRTMKLAHRPRIASTMIKLNFTAHFINFSKKTIKRIVADPKRKLSPPFDSADSVPSFGHPAPGFGQNAVAIYCALRLISLGDRDRSPGFG